MKLLPLLLVLLLALLERAPAADRRLEPLKDLDGYFPFVVPASHAAWEERSAELRRRILVATGLWPMPEKTPLRPVIHGRVARDGFTVEKVYFESLPGHFVTGILFRPEAEEGAGGARRRPAVLSPHGHGGRLHDYGETKIRELITRGEERFEGSGRFPNLARCAQLARMGCVTFIYDMLGYADSVQISYELAHRFATQRPDFDTPESWGFYSTQAEFRLQSVFGLQTWNSLRALDFLCDLPDVDPSRVGVTGGSGGGTQTIILCAIDPRPAAAFPQGMVSTSMQGGCTCENASLLRIGTGNVELAGLFAPKPQGMTAANDWTKDMMTKGSPELTALYTLLGAPGNVLCEPLLHFPHNYNYVTRAVMCRWFNRHLRLDLEEPIVEEDFRPLTAEEWTVWNDEHPRPEGGDAYERRLTRQLDDAARRELDALLPRDPGSLARYREVVGGALETIIGRGLPPAGAVEREEISAEDRGDYVESEALLRLPEHGEEVPTLTFFPEVPEWRREVIIWIDGRGKAALRAADGSPRPEVRAALQSGAAVVSADLFLQGERAGAVGGAGAEAGADAGAGTVAGAGGGGAHAETRTVRNPRLFAGYTFGYNHSLFAQRVHDILTVISHVVHDRRRPERVHLLGLDGAGPWVAAARPLARDRVARTAIETAGFRFGALSSWRHPDFLPGAVKYGDLPGLLALAAPHELWLAGEGGGLPPAVAAAYAAAGRREAVIALPDGRGQAAAAVAWTLELPSR
jgi:hypothetical protein